MTLHAGKISQSLNTVGLLSVCLACLVTPLSTSLLGIFSALAGLCWLFAGGPARLPSVFRNYPSTLVALILFSFMLCTITYSPAQPAEAFSVLKKYRELAMLPVVFCLFSMSAKFCKIAVNCFLAGCIILMLLSYLMFFDQFPGERYGYSVVFHITHSFFMAVLAFWTLHNSMKTGKIRYFWSLVFLAAVINIIYIAPGRTGMFVFCCLMLLFLFQRLSIIKWCISMLIFFVLLAGAYHTSDNFSGRVHEAIQEIQQYEQGKSKTSVGQRFDWWTISLDLIHEKPLIGHGTGSYRILHDEAIKGTEITPTDNPHNEFFFITIQCGLIGLFMFFLMVALQLYEARKTPTVDRYLFQGVLLALLAGSLMNSLLFDSQQGHYYLFMSGALLAGTEVYTPAS